MFSMRGFLYRVLLLMLCEQADAAHSTDIQPPTGLVAQTRRAYVNTKKCTDPINSAPYIIVAGIGGGKMALSCPPEYPVMYSWNQIMGFAGLGSVQAGAGKSAISCCAIEHEWVQASPGLSKSERAEEKLLPANERITANKLTIS